MARKAEHAKYKKMTYLFNDGHGNVGKHTVYVTGYVTKYGSIEFCYKDLTGHFSVNRHWAEPTEIVPFQEEK